MSDNFDWSQHLWDEEEVLWQGRPDQRIVIFSWIDVPVAVFLYSQFLGTLDPQRTAFFVQIGDQSVNLMPWLAITIFIIIGTQRYGSDVLRRRRSHYAITNRRALMVEQKGSRDQTSTFVFSNQTKVFSAGQLYTYVVISKQNTLFSRLRSVTLFDAPMLPTFWGKRKDLVFLAPERKNALIDAAHGAIDRLRA
ncbi:MAG: hypothetical protein AAF376_01710 [Pseudomonadota bacterium]